MLNQPDQELQFVIPASYQAIHPPFTSSFRFYLVMKNVRCVTVLNFKGYFVTYTHREVHLHVQEKGGKEGD